MKVARCLVKVLFGCRFGGRAVYYVYVDEAGTSQREPVTVVAGVILHSDYWRDAAARLEELFDIHVPKDLRPGFHFHAKKIWSGYREYYEIWSRHERAKFIAAVASIPRELCAAISIGKVRRDFHFSQEIMPLNDFHHIAAFFYCLARANKYIRDWGRSYEVGTVVAEDERKNRKYLRKALKFTPPNLPLTADYILLTRHEKEAGQILQTMAGPIDRLVDTVFFAAKDEAPLLQISDACAYIFRRYLSGQNYGEEMIIQALGDPLVWEDWQGPTSEIVFSFHNKKRECLNVSVVQL